MAAREGGGGDERRGGVELGERNLVVTCHILSNRSSLPVTSTHTAEMLPVYLFGLKSLCEY